MIFTKRFEKSGRWTEKCIAKQNLILSWKAERKPLRILIDEALYASWEDRAQRSHTPHIDIHETQGDAFTVEYIGDHPIDLFVSSSSPKTKFVPPDEILLNVPNLCQYDLPSDENTRLCSPTSLSALLLYYGKEVDPVDFSNEVLDHGANIYGNWALNVSAANCYLKEPLVATYVPGLDTVYQSLQEGHPVIASVSSPLPYPEGHLLIICGLSQHIVYTMDPAKKEKLTPYPLDLFCRAWNHLTYLSLRMNSLQ